MENGEFKLVNNGKFESLCAMDINIYRMKHHTLKKYIKNPIIISFENIENEQNSNFGAFKKMVDINEKIDDHFNPKYES